MDELFAAPYGALLIFGLRIVDVSMAILRTLLAVRGKREVAALIGFFEVMIWLLAAGSALRHMDSIFHVVGYAGGFATGNFVGVWLEERFAFGVNVVRAVCRNVPVNGHRPGWEVAELLRERGFAVTEIPGMGREGEVNILNVVVPRRRTPEVLRVIDEKDPTAFVTMEEVRSTRGGHIVESGPVFFPAGRKAPTFLRLKNLT